MTAQRRGVISGPWLYGTAYTLSTNVSIRDKWLLERFRTATRKYRKYAASGGRKMHAANCQVAQLRGSVLVAVRVRYSRTLPLEQPRRTASRCIRVLTRIYGQAVWAAQFRIIFNVSLRGAIISETLLCAPRSSEIRENDPLLETTYVVKAVYFIELVTQESLYRDRRQILFILYLLRARILSYLCVEIKIHKFGNAN